MVVRPSTVPVVSTTGTLAATTMAGETALLTLMLSMVITERDGFAGGKKHRTLAIPI